MAQTKAQRSKAAKKAAATRKKKAASEKKVAPVESSSDAPVPGPFGPNNNREDSQAVVGHFAEAVSGEHKGRYGTLEEVAVFSKDGEPEVVVFRTRDDKSERLVVKYSDLRPAESGRR